MVGKPSIEAFPCRDYGKLSGRRAEDSWRRGVGTIPNYPAPHARATIRRKLFEPLPPLPLFRNVPARSELRLYAEILFESVRLVRGKSVLASNEAAVRIARYWIKAGNVGTVTFDACCAWLGWDAEHTREKIFSTLRAS
jgi:hypothetical protein